MSCSKILRYSPGCGVITALVPDITFKISGTSAEASSNSFVPIDCKPVINVAKATGLAVVIPIPMAAASGFFGRLDKSQLAERVVNSSVDKGKAIIFGECD